MKFQTNLIAGTLLVIAFNVGELPLSAAEGDAAVPIAFTIDADFPGGNILLKGIDGDTVEIAQDPRDTGDWWFYYHFRVRGAGGRTLKFVWKDQDPMAALGPAVSVDAGHTWKWLGKEHVAGASFTYSFAADAADVRFCLAMPYQFADLQRFIKRHRNNPNFRVADHATTPKDRHVQRLHVGKLDGEPQHRVLFTARHHCCEMMASYTMEGIIDAVLADSGDGRWLREHVEFLAVPLMDLDGVEDGDQGKNRRPHDHNRDYEGTSRYASVAANKEFVPKWANEKLRIAIDLHCPWVRGGGTSRGSNEQVYFVGGPDVEIWRNTEKFAIFLEAVQTGPLPFSTQHNLPHGESWNTLATGQNRTFSRWASTIPGVDVASTIEIPYATAGGKQVTPESARALGRDLASALRRYLQDRGE